jgi:hypothetical protein
MLLQLVARVKTSQRPQVHAMLESASQFAILEVVERETAQMASCV